MRSFETEVFINRPPQVVSDYMSNSENEKLWQASILSSEWTSPGPIGPGSTKRVVTKVLGRKIAATAVYTEWDPPHRFTFTSNDSPFKVKGTILLDAKGEGTQITLKAQLKADGILKLLEGLIIKQVEKQDTRNYHTLKRLLEAG